MLAGMKTTPKNRHLTSTQIRLGDMDEVQIRAWVDAGYMSAEEYQAEMERRRSEAGRK